MTPATRVLSALQQFLRDRGGRLCFLQSREVPGATSDNDVDMVVDARSKSLLKQAFVHLRDAYDQHLVQAIQWDVPFCYYFVLASENPSSPAWLRPDITWDPQQASANFISSEELLDHCIEQNGFLHLRPDVEWAYQVFKRLRKGGATPAQMAHAHALQRTVDTLTVGHQLLERRLPRAIVHEVRGAIEDQDGERLRTLAKVAIPLLHLPRSLSEQAEHLRLQALRAQARWEQSVGLVVWLHGDDAAAARLRAQRLAKAMGPVFRDRHRITPLNARVATTPSLYRQLRLSRGELCIFTVHPGQPLPDLPTDWGVRVAADECPNAAVLRYLEERMTRRGWYAVSDDPAAG